MIKKHGQILLALPFLFSSCNHWGGLCPGAISDWPGPISNCLGAIFDSPEAQKGSEVKIPVKICAVSIAGGAQNKTVMRAAGGKQERMVGGGDAGSNIYWDGSNLPFDKNDGTGNTKYQGVFFKWGSLIGVSPAKTGGGNDFSSGTIANEGQNDGTPIYLKVNGVWKKTNVAYAVDQGWISGSGWSAIPYSSVSTPAGADAHTLLYNPDFEHHKGDVCNYIDPAYRMPTLTELKVFYSSSGYSGFSSSSITNQTADGKTAFSISYGTFTGISGTTYYLPASGYRGYSSGTLLNVGRNGHFWSGSALSGGNDACSLYFYSSSACTDSNHRRYGFSVRCVKIENSVGNREGGEKSEVFV
jgi:hypothetical protein